MQNDYPYNLLNRITCSKDFFECFHNVLEFTSAARTHAERTSLVRSFYDQPIHYGLSERIIDNIVNKSNPHYICDGPCANLTYLSILVPRFESPVKTLKKVQKFAEQTLEDFTDPIGPGISKEKISDILEYLDQRYNYSNLVFSKRTKPIFCILNVSNKHFNSSCLSSKGIAGLTHTFFLYCMNGTSNPPVTPEAVLFHELGHALHTRLLDSLGQFSHVPSVPQEIINYMETFGFHSLSTLTSEQQSEILADVLSMGMMYDSPFSLHDPFTPILSEDKQAYNHLFQSILARLEKTQAANESTK